MYKNNYDSKFDIIKFILSIFVVLVHTNVYTKQLHPWIKITVPMFFIIMSYFFFSKLKKVKSNKQRKDVLKIFVTRNIKLYFFWFCILIPLTLINHRNMTFDNGSVGFVTNAVQKLFLGSTYMSSWFITASIFGVIIIYFLSKKLSNKKLLFLSLFSFTFVTIWACYLPFFGSNVNRFYNTYFKVFSNPLHSFPASLIWIVVGKCFAEKTFNLSRIKSVIFFLLSFVLLYMEWIFVGSKTNFYESESYFLLLPVCISLFGFILTIKPIRFNKSVYLKRCSTVIYTLHGTLIPSINYLWYNIFNINSCVLIFLTDIIICIFTYTLIQLYIDKKNNNEKIKNILKNSY